MGGRRGGDTGRITTSGVGLLRLGGLRSREGWRYARFGDADLDRRLGPARWDDDAGARRSRSTSSWSSRILRSSSWFPDLPLANPSILPLSYDFSKLCCNRRCMWRFRASNTRSGISPEPDPRRKCSYQVSHLTQPPGACMIIPSAVAIQVGVGESLRACAWDRPRRCSSCAWRFSRLPRAGVEVSLVVPAMRWDDGWLDRDGGGDVDRLEVDRVVRDRLRFGWSLIYG